VLYSTAQYCTVVVCCIFGAGGMMDTNLYIHRHSLDMLNAINDSLKKKKKREFVYPYIYSVNMFAGSIPTIYTFTYIIP